MSRLRGWIRNYSLRARIALSAVYMNELTAGGKVQVDNERRLYRQWHLQAFGHQVAPPEGNGDFNVWLGARRLSAARIHELECAVDLATKLQDRAQSDAEMAERALDQEHARKVLRLERCLFQMQNAAIDLAQHVPPVGADKPREKIDLTGLPESNVEQLIRAETVHGLDRNADDDARELWIALNQLSYECFGAYGVNKPSRATYNRTFAVMDKYRTKYSGVAPQLSSSGGAHVG